MERSDKIDICLIFNVFTHNYKLLGRQVKSKPNLEDDKVEVFLAGGGGGGGLFVGRCKDELLLRCG